ncbi:MAG: hypothetical protein ACKO5K_00425 [Armatimonadota bacterium]
MSHIPCSIEHGHLFLHAADGAWLVDTGSPISIGPAPSVEMAGHTIPLVPSAHAMDARSLSEFVGGPVAGLLGMDFLRHHDVRFDPAGGTATIDPEAVASDGHPIPISLRGHIIVLDANVGGEDTELLMDTGAPLSYWQSGRRTDFPTEVPYDDFHPLLGRFVTTVHRVPVRVGGWEREVAFGHLPAPVGTGVEMMGVSGILGLDVFAYGPVDFNFRQGRLILPRKEGGDHVRRAA